MVRAWFLTLLRALGLLPQAVAAAAAEASAWLTGLAMAALGLMVDVRIVIRAGSRVSAAASLSVLLLGTIGCGLLKLLRLI